MLLTLLQATAQASNTASKINVEQAAGQTAQLGNRGWKRHSGCHYHLHRRPVYHQANQPTGQQNSGKT